jgi:hypothetical protein
MWCGKNPHQKLGGYGQFDWIVLLIRDRDVRDVVYTILSEIESGIMEPQHSSWLTDIPESWKSRLGAVPGWRDPHHTMIAVGRLTKFAIKRGEKPKFLAHLMADSVTHTGAAGRPTSMHLVEREMKRRAAEGKLAAGLSEEARQLSEWMKLSHPDLAPPKPKTIRNSLGKKYRALKASKPSPKL